MRYAAIIGRDLESPKWVCASPVAGWTWVKLYWRAAKIETGGILAGYMELDDRQLITLAGVTKAEINEAAAAGLITIRGSDLAVEGYDNDGQAAVQTKRENGKLGGRPPKDPPDPNNLPVTPRLTEAEPKPNPSPLPPSPSPSSPNLTKEEEGGGGENTTPSSLSPVQKILKQIGPLWTAKYKDSYGSAFMAKRQERRDLGVLLSALRNAGPAEEAEALRLLPDWYTAFLDDHREVYLAQRHALHLFLADLDQFRVNAKNPTIETLRRWMSPEEKRAQKAQKTDEAFRRAMGLEPAVPYHMSNRFADNLNKPKPSRYPTVENTPRIVPPDSPPPTLEELKALRGVSK